VNRVQSDVTSSNVTSKDVLFPNGKHTTLVEAVPGASAKDITNALGLITQGAVIPKAVILIVGGTSILDSELQARRFQLFSRDLARAVAESSALIIDGSTEGGVMTALGKALLDHSNKASLLGIANDGQITWPGRDDADGANGRKMLESTYTHFVVVKGADSSGGMDTMYGIAEKLSRDIPVLTILVNESPVPEMKL
jgi:SLOG in TRPM, prokaryote